MSEIPQIDTRRRHEEKRWGVLGDAIMKTIQAGEAINTEWVEEYNELTGRVKHASNSETDRD